MSEMPTLPRPRFTVPRRVAPAWLRHRLARLRPARPGRVHPGPRHASLASRAVAGWTSAALAVPLAAVGVAAAVTTTGHPARVAHRSAAAPAPWLTPTLSPQEQLEFERAARRPAAAPPLPSVPQIDLSAIKVAGIPRVALAAYVAAARSLARSEPACRLAWPLVAGIGLVESGHARDGGSGSPAWDGIARPPILGPLLDGHGFAAIPDTDHGVYDGNTQWDRAVGPMQFLPSTWSTWGADGDGDHRRNPQDIWDAALATGRYLCATGGDLSTAQGMAVAVYSYNHSFDYVRLVLSVAARYAGVDPNAYGVDALPSDPPSPSPSPSATRRARRAPAPRRASAHRQSGGGSTRSGGSGGSGGTSGGSGGTQPSSGPVPAQSPPPTSPPPAPTIPVPSPSLHVAG